MEKNSEYVGYQRRSSTASGSATNICLETPQTHTFAVGDAERKDLPAISGIRVSSDLAEFVEHPRHVLSGDVTVLRKRDL